MTSLQAWVPVAERPLFAPDDTTLPNFADIAAALIASARWIVACVVLLGAAGFGIYKLQVPVHTSVARVLVQTEQLGAPSFLSGITPYRDSQIPEAANRRLETEMALVVSQSNAVEVVRALGLTERQLPAPPIVQARRWLADHVPAKLRDLLPKRDAPVPAQAQVDASTAEALLANVSIEPVRSKVADTTSNVLEVKLKTADAAVAPNVLQALLDAYLRNSNGKNQLIGSATTALLDRQVAEAQAQLDELEGEFLRLANRRSSRSDGSVPASTGTAAGPGPAGADSTITQLTNQVVELQAKLEEQRVGFTEDAPSVRNLRERLAAARGRLASTIRASASDNVDQSRLERQRGLLQDRYLELRRKRDQITLFTQLNPSAIDGREIVDAPTQPDEATAGRSKLPLLLGPVAGLLLGLVVAALRELANQRLRSARDVERTLGLATLGRLPRLERTKVLSLRAATLSRPELKALARP